MNRIFPLLTIIVLFTISAFAQVDKGIEEASIKRFNDELLYKYMTVEEWVNGSWSVLERGENKFNNDYKLIESINESYSDGSLNFASKIVINYSNNKVASFITLYDKDGSGNFSNAIKLEYDYDNGLQNGLIQYIWDGDNSEWVKKSKAINSYSNNHITETVNYIWQGGFMWGESSKDIYEYDGDNQTLHLRQEWNGSDWEIISKVETEFTNDKKTQRQHFTWDGSDWVLNEKDTWTYNNNGLVETHIKESGYSSFVSKYRETYTYEDGNLSVKLEESNIIGLSTWVPQTKTFYTYLNGKLTEELIKTWIGATYENSEKRTYEYNTVSVNEKNLVVNDFSVYQNYPNPFNPSTTIKYNIAKSGNYKLSVYNSLGEKVAELFNGNHNVGQYSVNFTADNLSSGIYFYILEGEGIKQSKKMILMK